MVKMIVMDLDGTLLIDNKKISQYTANIDETVNNIAGKYPECKLTRMSGSNWFIFTHKKANKMNAITAIAEEENTDIGEILAFGDDYSDIEMLQCGIGVAVGNAANDVKKSAKFICGNNNDDGVREWIQHNVINNYERKSIYE